jgi:uncharacterized membrane protein
MSRRGFNFRSFTSFILTWTFLTLVVSGAVLYIAPPGRIANWTRWQLMILTKEQWQALHTLTAVVFLVGGLFHLLKFNWKSFLIYLRKKADAGQHLRYEMIASLVLFLLILAGTIAQQPPFQTIMAAGDLVRQSWEDPASVSPIPHMEEMTLREFAKNIQMEPDKLVQSLQTLGYSAASQDEPLQQLAKRYQRSPVQILAALKTNAPASAVDHQPAGGSGGDRGQGFKTLAELATENGLSSEAAIQNLAAKGIQAKADDKMRDIANRSGRKPYEVIEILKGNERK